MNSYNLANVFPPRTIEIMLSPEQQESLELISIHMSEIGIDDSMALEEALDMGLAHYLDHFRWRNYELAH